MLIKDHRIVDSIFERIESLPAGQDETRDGLFAQLLYELDTHAIVEEKLFYPRMRCSPDDKDLVAEAELLDLGVKLQEAKLSNPKLSQERAA